MSLHQNSLSYSHYTNTNVALKKYILAANSSHKNVFHWLSGFPSTPHLQASEEGNLSRIGGGGGGGGGGGVGGGNNEGAEGWGTLSSGKFSL